MAWCCRDSVELLETQPRKLKEITLVQRSLRLDITQANHSLTRDTVFPLMLQASQKRFFPLLHPQDLLFLLSKRLKIPLVSALKLNNLHLKFLAFLRILFEADLHNKLYHTIDRYDNIHSQASEAINVSTNVNKGSNDA